MSAQLMTIGADLASWLASLDCPPQLLRGWRVSVHHVPLQGRELFSFLLGGGLHKLFMILLHGRLVSSPPFTNVFNHLFMSVWTHGHLFYTLASNPRLLYFVAHSCSPGLPCLSFKCAQKPLGRTVK